MQQSVLKVQELGAPPEGFESSKPSSKRPFGYGMNGRKQSLPSKSQSHGKKLKFLLNVVQLTIWLEWTFFTLYRECIQGRRNGTIPGTHRTMQFGYDEA